MNAPLVKDHARACGADLCGIAPIERFADAPATLDPRQIFPATRSVIVLGFRILRGCLRGAEEGTHFIAYNTMGYAGQNWVRMPVVMWNFCRWIEDRGYEAVPLPNIDPWSNTDLHTRGPGPGGRPRPEWSRPVAPGKAAPDVWMHFRIAAFCAGLGEIGWGRIVLTPRFGPRQRLGAVLTDAALEPDPLQAGPPLCDRCMACVRDCPGGALSPTESVRVTVAGRELEFSRLDVDRCYHGLAGGDRHRPFHVELKPVYEYARSVCAGRGCIRSCMDHLEKQGKLANAFQTPFRQGDPWALDARDGRAAPRAE
jgi:ferredoxin